MKNKLLVLATFLAFSLVAYSQMDMAITNVEINNATSIEYNRANSYNVTITNVGQDPLTQTLNTEIFLSRDQIWDTGDLLLANQVTSTIDPGGSRIINLSVPFSYGGNSPVPIPFQTYQPGTYYLIAITNFYSINQSFLFSESSRTNNQFVLPTTLPMPDTDLRIISANIPDSVTFGVNKLDYSFSLDGTDFINTFYSDRIFLSKDQVLNVGDISVGGYDNISLNTGGTKNRTDISITIPLQTIAGDYYLIVALDNATSNSQNIVLNGNIVETDETNNQIIKRIYVKGREVDVAIESVVCDSVVQTGLSFPIVITTKNIGKVNVGAFKAKYYFSSDQIIDASDIVFSQTNSGSSTGLVAGNSVTENLSLFLNTSTILPGKYYIITKTDADNAIEESNETNNLVIKEIEVVAPYKDIAINSLSLSKNPLNVATSFSLSTIYKNKGALATGSFYANIYLSTDNILDGSDLKLNTNPISTSSINAGSTSSVSYSSLTIPFTVLTGNYFLILVADATNLVNEKFEDNNIATTALSVVGYNFDLEINSIDSYPVNVPNNGTTMSFAYKFKNNSTTAIPSVNSKLYFSNDSIYDVADVLLATHNYTYSTAIGATSSAVSLSFTRTNATPPGDYYLIIKTDATDTYTETNELNNFRALKIRVDEPFKDLTTQFLTDTVPMIRSLTTNVSYNVVNIGNIGFSANQQTKLFLSNDNVLNTTTDREIAVFNTSGYINAGASLPFQKQLNLTDPAGTYYLFAVADFLNYQVESNENNNANYTVIQLEDRVVDMTVSSDTAQYVVKLNNIARQFPIKVFNSGNSQVSATVYYYLSNDSTSTLSDKTFLGYSGVVIEKNTSGTANLSYIFNPNTTLPAKKYLLCLVDPDNTLADTNLSDNFKIIPIEFKQLEVDLQLSAVSTKVNSITSNEVVSGNNIEITATISNVGADTPTVTSGINVNIYYSQDNLYQNTDIYIGSRSTGPNATFTVSLGIPPSVVAGDGYLIFRADVSNVVIETDETNNDLAYAIKVLAKTYDFSGQFTNVNPTDSIIAGTSKVITYSGTNTTNYVGGNVAYTKIYLSTDTESDISDIDVIGTASLATNSANNTVSTNATINIPTNQAGGNYHLVGFIDANNSVEETNETNNYFHRPIKIVARSLDLRVDSVRFDNGNNFLIGSGAQTITLRYGNFGNVALSFQSYPIIRVLLSADDVADNNDIVLRNYQLPYGSLAINSRHSIPLSLTIPANTAVGDYKMIVVMDANNTFAETNEENNTTMFNYRISSVVTSAETKFESNEIGLYPNPTTNMLYLNSGIDNYGIINALGMKIEIGKASSNSINVSHLANGIYYLQVSIKGISHNLKFVKF